MADWQSIKTEYITTDTSYRKLAQKYGVSYVQIGNVGREENWVELRKQHLNKTLTKSMNAIASQQASRAARLQTVADKLLTKVELLIEDDKGLLADTSSMRDISRILKDLKDIQMIRSEADMQEQDARIKKLQKEAMVEKENNEIKVTIEQDLDEYSK